MRKLLIVLTLSVLCISINGQTVSVEQARMNVMEFLNSKDNKSDNIKSNGPEGQRLKLVYTASCDKGEADYYVFNDTDGGFIVAGGDELSESILAYSDEGSFDISNIPDNFRYLLSEYQRQIEFAKNHKNKVSSYVQDARTRKTVDVLIKTKWDQGSPYNANCPKVGGKSTYTGCVATAMAQVMKYHSWPKTGAGSHSYYDSESKKTLSSDFSTHTYDWTNMANKYSSMSKTAQKEAVALLMSDCGIGVEMGYTTSGSGAWSENITYALVKYFGYDKGAAQIIRDYTTASDWDSLLYNELANNRPVIFSGADKSYQYGHCFVCDGYNSNTNKYHFNWGWSGQNDCYCSLSAVQIDSDNDYRYLQDIIIGIQPPAEDTKAPVVIYAYDGAMNMKVSQNDGYNTYTVQYLYDNNAKGVIYNHSYRDLDVIFAMKYVNTQTGESYVTAAKDIEANTYSFRTIYPLDDEYTLYGVGQVVVKDAILPNMPAGEYKVILVAKDYLDKETDDANLWHEVMTYDTNKNYVTVKYIPTGIDRIAEHDSKPTYKFDLSGRKASTTTGGIIIHDGRKYLK